MEESAFQKDELRIDKVPDSGPVEKYFPEGPLHHIRTTCV